MATEEKKFPEYLDHLNKTFLEELSYKLWVTKGTRFHSNKRLLSKNDWSTKSNGFLSAYLIILGLLSVYQISTTNLLNANFVAFGSTAISILLLVFTQMEAAQDYKVQAHLYLQCSLDISKLYNELRIFKTMTEKTEQEKIQFCDQLSTKYQAILDKYPNHDTIDFLVFKAEQRDYYKITWRQAQFTYFKYYYKTTFLYHVLIGAPIVVTITALILY